jgi:hypothetical protein
MKKILLILLISLIGFTAFGQLKAPRGLQVGRYKAGSNVITVDSTINVDGNLVDFVLGDSTNVMRNIPLTRRKSISSYLSYDYIVEKIASTYYATGRGLTSYSNASASVVLNSAMGQLTSGGSIFIRRGLYDAMTPVVFPNDNITIKGEGLYLTTLKLANSADAAGRADLFYIGGKDSITIKDLCLDGNGRFQTRKDNLTGTTYARSIGIQAEDTITWLDPANNILVENCLIKSWTQDGIVIGRGENAIIRNCRFIDNYWAGLEFWPRNNGGWVDGCYFLNNGAVLSAFGHNAKITNLVVDTCHNAHFWSNTTRAGIHVEYVEDVRYVGDTKNGPNNVVIDNVTFLTMDSMLYGIMALNSPNKLTIRNCNFYGGNLTTAGTTSAITVALDTNTVIENIGIFDWPEESGYGINMVNSNYATVSNVTMTGKSSYGVYIEGTSDGNIIQGSNLRVKYRPIVIYDATGDNNIITNNTLYYSDNSYSDWSGIYDIGVGTIKVNNVDSKALKIAPDVITKNKSYTATADGLTDGLLRAGTQNITVTSANAAYICCLPTTSTATIGTVITGQVGANGFELRPIAAQAGTVYINGVTTNVEAAIPANSSFEIKCINAVDWILKAWTALGAEITAIIPDAI